MSNQITVRIIDFPRLRRIEKSYRIHAHLAFWRRWRAAWRLTSSKRGGNLT